MFSATVLHCCLVFLLLIEQSSSFSITSSAQERRITSKLLRGAQLLWKGNVNTEPRERYSLFILHASGGEKEIDISEPEEAQLKKEEEDLQNELHYIQALVQRNKAQLGSFIDEKHQWEKQSEEDRYFLTRKPFVTKRLAEVRLKLTSFVAAKEL